jgi:hypothetical protein
MELLLLHLTEAATGYRELVTVSVTTAKSAYPALSPPASGTSTHIVRGDEMSPLLNQIVNQWSSSNPTSLGQKK